MKKNKIKNRYRFALACYSNIRTDIHAALAEVYAQKIMSKVYNEISKCPSFQAELFNQLFHNFTGNLREVLMPPREPTFDFSVLEFSLVRISDGKVEKISFVNSPTVNESDITTVFIPRNQMFRDVEGLRIPVEFKEDVIKAYSKMKGQFILA